MHSQSPTPAPLARASLAAMTSAPMTDITGAAVLAAGALAGVTGAARGRRAAAVVAAGALAGCASRGRATAGAACGVALGRRLLLLSLPLP